MSPFVIMQAGEDSVDPSDPNSVLFEDYRPRVVPSDTPDEVMVEIEDLMVPKDVSVQVPASSSEPSPPAPPPESELIVQPGDSQKVTLPTPPDLGPLPFPGAEPEDGKLSQSATG